MSAYAPHYVGEVVQIDYQGKKEKTAGVVHGLCYNGRGELIGVQVKVGTVVVYRDVNKKTGRLP